MCVSVSLFCRMCSLLSEAEIQRMVCVGGRRWWASRKEWKGEFGRLWFGLGWQLWHTDEVSLGSPYPITSTWIY